MAIDTLGANALASNAVTTAKIANDAVTSAKIPADAVVAADIADGSVTTAKLANNAVTSAKALNLGRRNLIINGDFQIFQRATSATNPGGGYDTVDRWRSSQSSGGLGNYNAEQSTDTPDGFGNSYKLTKSGATTQSSSIAAWIEQYFEGQNLQHLEYGTASAKSLTLSFHVKSSVTGTYGVALGDGQFGKSNVQTYAISSANTWEKKTVTFSGDTSTGLANDHTAELNVMFALGAGSSRQTSSTNTWISGNFQSTSAQTQWPQTDGATFYITGIQLEVGDTATDFEHRSFAEELAACQRYFLKSGNIGTSTEWFPGVATHAHEGNIYAQSFDSNQDRAPVHIRFPSYMRIVPTIVYYPGRNGVTNTAGSISIYNGNTLVTTSTKPVGGVAGLCGRFTGTSADSLAYTYQFTADAELG